MVFRTNPARLSFSSLRLLANSARKAFVSIRRSYPSAAVVPPDVSCCSSQLNSPVTLMVVIMELLVVPLALPASETAFLSASICRSRLRTSFAHADRVCATNVLVRAASSFSLLTLASAVLSCVRRAASAASAMLILRLASACFSCRRCISFTCRGDSARVVRRVVDSVSRCSASR